MQPGRTNGERPPPTPGAESPHPLELPEIVFTAIFIPIAAFSWVGILLAELGAFSGWRVFAGGALLSTLALGAAGRDCRAAHAARAPVSRPSWIFLALIVATATALFSRPGEFLIEGADASVYLSVGRNIAKTGGIPSADPVVGLVPQELYSSFFAPAERSPNLENRLPGGLRLGADGRIHPDFFHLLPVWIAIATVATGLYGGYFVNVALAVLGVSVVWLVGRRTWSPAAGAVAAALLAVNFGEIYYARLASSEMLAQFLLLSGTFFTVVAWDSRLRVAGACAGAAIGLAAFTRIDLLLLMVPLAVLWLWLTRSGQMGRAWRWYAATLVLLAGHAAIHAVTVSAIYTQRLFDDGWKVLAGLQAQMDTTALLAAALLTGVAALAIKKLRRRWLAWAALGVILTLSLLSPAVVVTMSRLLSPVGLAVAIAGAIILTRPMNWRVLPVLVPFLAEAAFLLAWRETSTLPADFRRAVPAVLPGAILLIGFVVATVGSGRGWPSAAVWLLPVGLGGWFLAQTAPILRTPPARDIHAQVAQLADQVPPDAVVVTDRSVPGHLALALQYTFGRSALRMDARPAGDDGIAPLVERVLAAGRPVFAATAPLVGDRPTGLRRSDVAGFDMRETFMTTLRYGVIVQVRGRFPRTQRLDEVPVTLYRISRRDTQATAARPFTIDIGDDDFVFIIGGFHEAESFQSARGRWTTGDSRIALPRVASAGPANPTIVLRLSAHRPPGMEPAAVRLAIDELPIGVISSASSDLREYRLPLPAPILTRLYAGPTTLTISTDFFVPKAVGLNEDNRRLGIVLDWIRIE